MLVLGSTNKFSVLSLLVPLLIIRCCHSQLLHPRDMVVGKWNVTIRRRDKHIFESMIFPKLITSDIEKKDYTSQSSQKKKKFQCELILHKDGRFSLEPPSSGLNVENINIGKMKALLRPLKGQWRVDANPYCVTDRHYDELTLLSDAKVRIPQKSSQCRKEKDLSNCVEHLEKWDQIRVELNCNVWGRLGSNPIRHMLHLRRGKDAGRMVKGTISIINSVTQGGGDYGMEETKRVLCGTFEADHRS